MARHLITTWDQGVMMKANPPSITIRKRRSKAVWRMCAISTQEIPWLRSIHLSRNRKQHRSIERFSSTSQAWTKTFLKAFIGQTRGWLLAWALRIFLRYWSSLLRTDCSTRNIYKKGISQTHPHIWRTSQETHSGLSMIRGPRWGRLHVQTPSIPFSIIISN